MGYITREFWDIVENYWNKDIFEKVDGIWRLKNTLWKLENPESYFILPTHTKPKEEE